MSRATELKPDLIEARINLGAAYFASQKYKESADAYRQAIRIVPARADLHFNLGRALEAAGQHAEAIESYKKVIELYRRFTAEQPGRYLPLVVKVFYSQALADTGEIDGAIDSLRDVLNELPPEIDPFRLRYDLGNLLFLEKRYDEAEIVYRRLLSRAHQVSEFTERAKESFESWYTTI